MDLAEYDPSQDKSMSIEVEGETHTLGNVLRDVMWSHPHVELASYTWEHPSKTEILVRCQTSGQITGEQAMVEALEITKTMLSHVKDTMSAAVERFEAEQQDAMAEEAVEGAAQEAH